MKSKYIQIFILSLTIIAVELSWTRIFSAEFYYSFAFLILSLAILGLGLGALALRLFKKLNNEKFYKLSLNLFALITVISPIIIFQLQIDFSKFYLDFIHIFKLILAIILLAIPYFFGGLALSYLLKVNNKDLPKLYMSDLIGAATGTFAILIIMNLIGTPKAFTMINILIPILLIILKKNIKDIILPVITIIIIIAVMPFSEQLFELPRKDRGKILFTHWDAMGKIRVVEYNEYTRGIRIDNAAQTSVYRFNGDFRNTQFKFDVNVSYLINKFQNCTFLSLGAGGGTDVLHALQEGATEVHAVEVNPYINYLLKDGELADYTGYVYNDSRVKVVTEDARTYVRRFKNKFDIILALSSNTYAALASGAFALAENYLFTTEAVIDYWNSLSENGYLIIEHHFYIPRLVSEVIDALNQIGVNQPNLYFAVYNLPYLHRNILLLSKKPLDRETINYAFGLTSPIKTNYIYPLYPAADSIADNLVNQIVNYGWKEVQQYTEIDISPCTDDRPFVAQLGLWKNFTLKKDLKILPFEFTGYPVSKLNLVVILAIIILIVIPLNLLPYKFSPKKLKFAPWLYFFMIGAGFMMLEVVLIQKFTLYIGASVYAIITILLTILLFSGLGSRFSEKFSEKIVFSAIILLTILEIFVIFPLTYQLSGFELLPRIIISVIALAPLSFFMGMPFPKAGKIVGDLIDWGFAVNGTASVLGSTLAILIAINFGFNIAMIIAAISYLIAFILINKKMSWN